MLIVENKAESEKEKCVNGQCDLISWRWITIICITTIDESTDSKWVRATLSAARYASFRDLRWSVDDTNGIFLRTNKTNVCFLELYEEISKKNLTTQIVFELEQLAARIDVVVDVLVNGSGQGSHVQQIKAEPKITQNDFHSMLNLVFLPNWT